MHTGLFMELKFHCYARAGPHGAFIPRPSAHPSVCMRKGGGVESVCSKTCVSAWLRNKRFPAKDLRSYESILLMRVLEE